jgi:glycosyltransferase involved in cell wall biosynthesis
VQPKLTVLIPSLGRKSIVEILRKISSEDYTSVIVMAHGKNAYAKIKELDIPSSAKVINCDENLSLSELCNIGLENVDTEYFAFFSDDDIWIEGKRAKLVKVLEENFAFDVVIGSTIEVNGKKTRKRPKDLLENNQGIFEYLYGKPIMFTNNRYVGLQDALFRNGVYPKFRPGLNVYEDVIWLADAQRMGHRVKCLDEIVSKKYPSMERSNERQNVNSVLDMYSEIANSSQNAAVNYLKFHSIRAAIATGDLRTYKSIVQERVRLIGISIGDSIIIPLQILTLSLFFIRNSMKL